MRAVKKNAAVNCVDERQCQRLRQTIFLVVNLAILTYCTWAASQMSGCINPCRDITNRALASLGATRDACGFPSSLHKSAVGAAALHKCRPKTKEISGTWQDRIISR